MRICNKLRGFTLVELMACIAIIALLAAVIFPVFVQARRKSYQATCLSNLRQLGMAFSMYAHDFDGKFAYGCDPLDKYSDYWKGDQEAEAISKLPLLEDLLNPYIRNKKVWHCPADIGFLMTGAYDNYPLNTVPSSYEKYGMSYFYLSGFGYRGFLLSQNMYGVSHNTSPPYKEFNPAEFAYLFDGSGKWHGGAQSNEYRFNALYADGHAHNIGFDAYNVLWSLQGSPP